MTNSTEPPDNDRKSRFVAHIRDSEFALTTVAFSDRIVEADQILRKGGLLPTLDHRLVELTFPGTRSRDDDESIDLKAGSPPEFLAGKLDGLKAIIIDDIVYELPFEKLPEATLRKMARIPDDKVIVQAMSNQPDIPLNDGAIVSFLNRETERFYTRDATIIVCVDGDREVEVRRGSYVLTKLIALLGIQAGYALSYINTLGNLVQVKPGDNIELFDGMKVFSNAACGGAS